MKLIHKAFPTPQSPPPPSRDEPEGGRRGGGEGGGGEEGEADPEGEKAKGGDKEQQGGGGGGGDLGTCFKMTSEANPYAGAFDLDVNVSVFESNIRILGGLLSGHLLAIDPDVGLYRPCAGQELKILRDPMGRTGSSSSSSEADFPSSSSTPYSSSSSPGECLEDFEAYDGSLLGLAIDLGDRMLPAFDTPTSIPYGTVNLKYGVPRGETVISSLAGAVSISLPLLNSPTPPTPKGTWFHTHLLKVLALLIALSL